MRVGRVADAIALDVEYGADVTRLAAMVENTNRFAKLIVCPTVADLKH